MPQLARWLTLIEQYDYEVQHREGKKHGNAGGLSRRPATKEVRVNEGVAITETEDSESLGPEELLWKIRALKKTEDEVCAKVREPSHEGSDPQEEGTLLERERVVDAFTDVRTVLRRSVERNKRYYDISVKTKSYEEGQWVLYFNLRKYRGIQMKWKRQYEGPYLITRVMSPLTVEIQRSAKARPKVVHVDKLKEFLGIPTSSWLDTRTAPDEGDASDPPLAAADQSSPEPGVSSAKTAEGTAMSVTAVDDSPAEGQPPKAADEVLELVESVAKGSWNASS